MSRRRPTPRHRRELAFRLTRLSGIARTIPEAPAVGPTSWAPQPANGLHSLPQIGCCDRAGLAIEVFLEIPDIDVEPRR